MADVFISYSRKDKDFVQRLDEALKKRERAAWVDWEGIRPTEEFMQAIYAAIESADTIVFVLSPDSVASAICKLEIAHATSHDKSLMPMVAREVNAAEVPDAMAKLNWIFFRDADDFDKATDKLITAFDTDLDWVRAHTRLLTRAVEWQAKARNSSFALRGLDLRAAEQWLAEAGKDKERQPTALQTEYIIASRKAAAKRQRIMLGAATVAMIITIALAIVAYLNAGKAKQTLADSDFLRAAELLDQHRVDEAMAFLARSLRTQPRHGAAADRTFTLLTQRGWMLPASAAVTLPGRIMSLRFTADGGCLAATVSQDAAQIFDVRSGKPLTPPLHHDGLPVQMARLSPDGKLLATACGGTKIWSACELWPRFRHADFEARETPGQGRIWDVVSGRPLTPPLDHAKAVLDVCFDAKSERVATASEDGTARVWDARTGKELRRWDLGRNQGMMFAENLAFTPDGRQLVTANANTTVYVLELP